MQSESPLPEDAAPDVDGTGTASSQPAAYLTQALKAAGVGTWVWHLTRKCMVWDDNTYQIFGVVPGEFMPTPMTVDRLLHPDDRKLLERQITICVAKGEDLNSEFRVIWPKDGSVHYVRARGRVYRDRESNDIRLTGACWDITQRKTLEEELAHERALLRTIMKHLPDKIYFKDAKSRFILGNDEMLKRFNATTTAEIAGKTDFDYFSEQHARQAFEDEQRIIRTGEPLRGIEEKETWPDGRITWVSTTKVPLRDDRTGEIIGTFGLSRDITDRRRAEEQLQKYAEELRRRNAELEEDLEMARELQGALMPRHYPIFAASSSACGSALRFSHVFNQATTVSGDFFDIIKISDTAAGIFICDVMGHGVRAALVAAIVRALIAELNGHAERPGEFLELLNRKLYGILSQTEIPMFASASYVIADVAKAELRFANAGHPEPLCIRHRAQASRTSQLHQNGRGPVLGLFDSPRYTTATCGLSVHDVVLQFTDGLYEVEGAGGELYDEKCLMQAVDRRADLNAGDLCTEVLAEIQQFSANKHFTDDVCLVAVEVDRMCA